MTDYKKTVFNAFKDKVDFDTYNKIVDFVVKAVEEEKAEENVKFYEHFRQLMTSINNAGWQDRHSQQISYISDVMGEICDKYEEYLP